MIKIKNQTSPKYVSPAEMEQGQVGIIRVWSVSPYVGRIVMKVRDDYLIHLDPETQRACGGWVRTDTLNDATLHGIELLPVGTVLEITL